MTIPLLKVQGLTKRFGGLLAVDNVDLHIDRGEIVGLIGPNGAGKTTFVELLTGGPSGRGGHIEFDALDITKLSNHERCRLGLSRTFQVPQPFHGSTVIENVVVGALFGRAQRNLSIEQAKRKAEDVLQSVGLGNALTAATSSLTTAVLKRLELARCLATDPKLVFLDEPLGGLNPTEVNEAIAVIRKVRDSGVTIVFIEHIVPAVLALCDRVVVLANGRKLAEGRGEDVISNPAVQQAYLGDVLAVAERYGRKRSGKVADGAASA